MISLVPGKRWLIASDPMTSSVMTPPAFADHVRLALAWAFIRLRVHARDHGDVLVRGQRTQAVQAARVGRVVSQITGRSQSLEPPRTGQGAVNIVG